MWTGWVYGAAILVSSCSMAVIDWRWNLAFFRDAISSIVVLVGSVCAFLLWDLLGITAGVFFRGPGPWMTGWQIAPEIPVEEVLFLSFLTQFSLVLNAAMERLADTGERVRHLMSRGVLLGAGLFLLIIVTSTGWSAALGSAGIRWNVQSWTYIAVIVPITILAVGLGLVLSRRRRWAVLTTAATLVVICVLTAVFDSLIVSFGIVDYDWSLTSGLLMGTAPVEDCGYAISAVVLVPAIWRTLHHRRRGE